MWWARYQTTTHCYSTDCCCWTGSDIAVDNTLFFLVVSTHCCKNEWNPGTERHSRSTCRLVRGHDSLGPGLVRSNGPVKLLINAYGNLLYGRKTSILLNLLCRLSGSDFVLQPWVQRERYNVTVMQPHTIEQAEQNECWVECSWRFHAACTQSCIC